MGQYLTTYTSHDSRYRKPCGYTSVPCSNRAPTKQFDANTQIYIIIIMEK